MKNIRNLFALLFIFSLIFLNSCGVDILEPLGENSYYVIRYSSSGSKMDVANTEYVVDTDNLKVYVESGYSYSLFNIKQVAQKFENNYRQMINIYGAHTDMDNNGKIKLIFVNINGNNSSSSMVMGYFLPSDLIYGSANNGEILYMDVNLLNTKPNDIAGTVLHEFQHLINFNVNYLKKGKEMSLWLDECLAESTAVLFDNSVVQSRIKEFNNIDYYCFYTWNLPSSIKAGKLINYPSASVFMNWLYIKNGRNSNIFRNIAKSTSSEDYNKVLYSVSGGSSWQNLLTNWISEVKNGQVSGASIKTRSYTTSLYPGAAIWDGLQVRVNSSTELSDNPSYIIVRANEVSGRSSINNEEISVQNMEIKIENNANNNETEYIDLVFDVNGKVRKY